ncbi:MAG: DinB family protein [Bacteroidia bacterium]
MDENTETLLRKQLAKHIEGGDAFMPMEEMLKEISFEKTGIIPQGVPYSFYQLFYHTWFAQNDILEFCRNPDYKAPKWPEGYWPGKKAPDNEADWNNLKAQYFNDRKAFCDYLLNSENNLFSPIPHGSGQTLLREAILITEHSAYHSGQLLIILRLLGLHF